MSSTNQYLKDHTPRIEDFILTRRQFLNRAGMGFGGLSLAGLFGQGFFPGLAEAAVNLDELK